MAAQIEVAGKLSFKDGRNWKKSLTRQGITTGMARTLRARSSLRREGDGRIECRKEAEYCSEGLSPG